MSTRCAALLSVFVDGNAVDLRDRWRAVPQSDPSGPSVRWVPLILFGAGPELPQSPCQAIRFEARAGDSVNWLMYLWSGRAAYLGTPLRRESNGILRESKWMHRRARPGGGLCPPAACAQGSAPHHPPAGPPGLVDRGPCTPWTLPARDASGPMSPWPSGVVTVLAPHARANVPAPADGGSADRIRFPSAKSLSLF